MVELRLMRAFVAVADELHFGRAARRLHLTQPALSKQVRQLEQALGVVLLLRTRRSVELTAAGRAFLEEARATLRQADRSVEAAQTVDGVPTGRLLVGFIDAAVYSVVPPIVRRFAETCPEVELVLADMLIPDQIDAVKERRLHVGVVHPPVVDEALRSELLLREPLILALPADHPLAASDVVDLGALGDEPVVRFPRFINPSLYDEITGLCDAAGHVPSVTRHATPKQTIVGLVSVGLGVSVLPACMSGLRRDGVVYRPFAGPATEVETSLIWRADERSSVVDAFVRTAREVT